MLPQKLTSVFYFAILMVFGLTACIGRFDGGDIFLGFGYNATEASMIGKITHASSSSIFDYWNNRFTCAKARPGDIIICCANECSGVWWVYRCSFVLCLFFASLLCAPRFFFPSAHRPPPPTPLLARAHRPRLPRRGALSLSPSLAAC